MMTSCNPDINCCVCVDKNFLRLQNRVRRPIWGSDGPGGQKCSRVGTQREGLKQFKDHNKISLCSLSSTRVRARRATIRAANWLRPGVTSSSRGPSAPTMSRPGLTVSPLLVDGVLAQPSLILNQFNSFLFQFPLGTQQISKTGLRRWQSKARRRLGRKQQRRRRGGRRRT